ncbi:hypothetical protein [Corynebacterium gerontici]|uniref:HNH endonuclease n=1 Tax=Corynebacterium gerontici TaxID=2079234 RepID=A0A3G6J294_9CORY|nr:hypothetical protein [Corynebacterium gerontici]AZA11088.1 hypothetical protein CGERO_03855 [Corynebacterium gerontici]
MTNTYCIICGTPSNKTRCPEHTAHSAKPSPNKRGYNSRWRRLSERARRLQPFCSDCGATADLQADHSPQAWQRQAQGKAIRLQDIDVVCGSCNRKRGAARGTHAREEKISHARP